MDNQTPDILLRNPNGSEVCRCNECGETFVIYQNGDWQNRMYCGVACHDRVVRRILRPSR